MTILPFILALLLAMGKPMKATEQTLGLLLDDRELNLTRTKCGQRGRSLSGFT